MGADGHLNFDTKIDSSGFNSGISKLGSIAKGGIAVLGTAVTGCIAAFAGLTKASLDAVASLEQNIGGVETLFGTQGAKSVEEYANLVGKSVDYVAAEYEMLQKAQQQVLDDANEAYKTAGLSANEYMETVNSIAASLNQSTASELETAEYANMAVRDMADNANKMGSSMESIQNAYQGFAKQNYTMLDNLKLGYGGTKSEMERLLADAKELTGIEYDIDSLADVYDAIHVIQEELGITGTTAKEAAETISGSMSMAQAAWDNFLAGTGTAEEFAEAVGTAAGNIISNLIDIVPRLASEIPTVISQIGETLAHQLETSYLGEVGLSLLESVVQGIENNAPVVLEKGLDIVSNLMTGIEENAPQMLTSGVELLASLVEGIAQRLPELVPQALQMVVTLADAVISNIPTIVQAGISLLTGLVQGIIQSLPTLITEGPRIINEFADAIYSGLGELLTTGWEMLKSLAQGIWDNKGLILENAGAILEAIINVFSLSKLFSLGKSLMTNLKNGIKSMLEAIKGSGGDVVKNLVSGIKNLATHPVQTLKNIATSAVNAFKNINWADLGRNIISGIVNGLTASAGRIVSAAKDAAKNALNAAKSFLGIKSPSRKFRDEVGAMMAEGIGIGFKDNIPVDEMNKSLEGSIQKMQRGVSVVTSGSNMNLVTQSNPDSANTTGFDYDEFERRQRKLNKERDERPIYLNGRKINREIKKGELVIE